MFHPQTQLSDVKTKLCDVEREKVCRQRTERENPQQTNQQTNNMYNTRLQSSVAPPAKRQRLSTPQNQWNVPPRETPQELTNKLNDLKRDIEAMVSKVSHFVTTYQSCFKDAAMLDKNWTYQSRISQKLQEAEKLLESVTNEKEAIKITMALVSSTGRGKSYICMCYYALFFRF